MRPILIVATNADRYEGHGAPTGLWFSELTHFYDAVDADIPTIIASLQGGEVPLDPVSLRRVFMDKASQEHFRDGKFRQKLRVTEKVADIDPEDFSAVYFTGGHGTMFDFPGDEDIQRFTVDLYKRGGLVSAVCHGVGALTTVKDGAVPLISGKKVTGFSNMEERLAMRTNHVPFLLEDALKDAGAVYSKAKLPYTSHVVSDGQFITGQNPQSPAAVGKAVHAELMKTVTPGYARRQRTV